MADKSEMNFSLFSFQYVAIGVSIIVFALLNLKSIKLLLKITQYGAVSVCLYMLFIIIAFIRNLSENGSIADIEKAKGI